MKIAEWRRQKKTKPSKYRSERTVVNGITYDSKKEARHVETLALLARKGLIKDFVRQPRFKFDGLCYDSGRVIEYRADAAYSVDGILHVVDVKGVRTPAYKIKKALMLKWFGIKVEEV